uniref:Uncharacterized protein n=1 Tax=Anguilla anguilla TaxID=7936 RepID=A0A0E9RHZ7_ANGAN
MSCWIVIRAVSWHKKWSVLFLTY